MICHTLQSFYFNISFWALIAEMVSKKHNRLFIIRQENYTINVIVEPVGQKTSVC